MDVRVVVLAGGVGSRLWPLSRNSRPKQFLDLIGTGRSMLQETVLRTLSISNQPPIILCAEEHRFIAAEQLREIGCDNSQIVLEPIPRNTAAAITLAALLSRNNNNESDETLLVLSADHFISDNVIFESEIRKGLELAKHGYMVTFGVIPSHAETGYGYIKVGEKIENLDGFLVENFFEKPTISSAENYFISGGYLWNSGIFSFKVSTFLDELKKFEPKILEICQKSLKESKKDMDFVRISENIFSASPSLSIDYAVMEHTHKAAVIPLTVGWSDLGAWDALWNIGNRDEQGNVLFGDVCIEDSSDTYVHASARLVALVGVEDLVVVETKDAVLVANRNQSQSVKRIVDNLKMQGREEHRSHTKVYRPWGVYESIDEGARYQVKRITVQPKSKLSVQMHHHRAEHWIVVSGVAKVTNGGKTYLVTENESTYIPIGQVHALENPGVIPLELIEVQSGAYLGEDDIVRFEDKYGRA